MGILRTPKCLNDTHDTVTLDTHALPEKIKNFFAKHS